VRRDTLDEAVEEAVRVEFAAVQKHFTIAPAVRAAPVAVVDWTARRRALETKRARVVEAFTGGDMARSDMRAALSRLDVAATALDVAERDAADVVPIVDTPAARRRALAVVRDMAKLWRVGETEERRRVLGILAERIEVASDGAPRVVWRNREALFLAGKTA
jgi:DNA-binding transcriptional regulator YdaS (Cro superfamily)